MKNICLRLFILIIVFQVASVLNAQGRPYLPTAIEGANWILLNSEIDYPNLAYLQRK